MTIFIEISNPPQWRLWSYHSPVMHRFGFAWFAIGVLCVPFREFSESSYRWEDA